MALPVTTTCILSVVSFVAGILSAIAGSSGLIILPSLFLAGLPPHLALGTSKLFTTTGLFTSAWTFMRRDYFQPRQFLAAVIATLLGSLAGALLALIISNVSLNHIVPLFLLSVAIMLLLSSTRQKKAKPAINPTSLSAKVMSVLLGLYSGFIGAGTGSLWTALAMRLFNNDMVTASAMSRFMCFIANFSALLVFMMLHQVDYVLGISLSITGCIGAYIGTHLAIRGGATLIRPLLLLVTAAMAVSLLIKTVI
ncbi:MAG: sulfite exporter TauE/SafE family protein [Coxiellaceae bacterium]|nr:sulfite exporter TauE/SafE family protein [Coxiellaceae bacterium]